MRLYFAPMEGITGYIFRNAHSRHFAGIDRYYTPFITTHKNKGLTSREKNDVLPEHNEGVSVVPQILSNNGEDFIKTARLLYAYGYREVNLNLGCPSRTVVTKQKGAGFLAETERLDQFLDQIFSGLDGHASHMDISIKTRIGLEAEEEWEELQAIFQQYPVKELIIHPRLQKEYYNGTPHRRIWGEALRHHRYPVCYNGDLFTAEQIQAFVWDYPGTEAVMLGRGLLVDPGLAERWKRMESASGKEVAGDHGEEKRAMIETSREEAGNPGKERAYARIRSFHDELYEGYRRVLSGDRDVLFKMKELWFYLIHSFPAAEDMIKKIRKAQRCLEYEQAVREIFRTAKEE